MIRRLSLLSFAVSAALILAACGGSEDSATPTAAPTADASSETTVDAAAEPAAEETVAEAPVADEGDDGGEGCDQVLTTDEIDSILGTTVAISGAGQICMLQFASDSIGTFQVFSGSKADEAMDFLLPKFLADETASANGVLLDDGRGFVLDTAAIVRGDSGRVFRFDTPRNVEAPDMQTAMVEIAELLLTR